MGVMNKDICYRAFRFSVKIVSMCNKHFKSGHIGKVFGNQLIRSATSVSANIEGAKVSPSRADFDIIQRSQRVIILAAIDHKYIS